ncbi:hypothetical protein [Paraburkholderia antibiotica]|uniref:Uncharacterized protein n=1 Tax=Paraburkholderia antibiotica TaxID=2728839 RepID=A0A7Y0FGC8_9BURK|nr:hypothetical protein [Paraburkholderia antibiotica]NML34938.1 hypothetical protein [Paraburkholderia antibiotica]
MALPDFIFTGEAVLSANGTSQYVAVPATGTPTQVILTNLGPAVAYVGYGTTVTVATGHPLVQNVPVVMNLNSATNIAAITTGDPAQIRITAGK